MSSSIKKNTNALFKSVELFCKVFAAAYSVEIEQKADGDWKSSTRDSAKRAQTEDEEDLSMRIKGATVTRDWRPAPEMPHMIQVIQVWAH